MKLTILKSLFVLGIVAIGTQGTASAATMTCPTSGTFNRQATVTNVTDCAWAGPVQGTPQASDVTAEFGGTWVGEGNLAGASGHNDQLTVNLESGSWGQLPVSGTWNIDSTFWNTWGRAVLTFHLGNGAGDPDWFFFEVNPHTAGGTFDIVRLSGAGGGLSNVFLWGSGDPTRNLLATPEPGTLVLFGLGLTALAAAARSRLIR